MQCGMPNFSSSLFDLSLVETSYSFDPLEDQTLGNLTLPPPASSTPKKQDWVAQPSIEIKCQLKLN